MKSVLARIFVAVVAILLSTSAAFGSCSQPANAIEAENCQTGSPHEQWYVSGAGRSDDSRFRHGY